MSNFDKRQMTPDEWREWNRLRDLKPGDLVNVSFRHGFWGTVVTGVDDPRGLTIHHDAIPAGTWVGLDKPDPDRPVTITRAGTGRSA